jgi:hypothetical protein
MQKSASALLSIALASLIATTPAYAQPSGLRLQGQAEGFTLRESDSGLRLRFSADSTQISTQAFNATSATSPLRNTLRADWPVFGYGLHTSLGLSWNSQASLLSNSGTSMAPSSFFGLGWRGEPLRNSNLQLSAELGTNISSSSNCSITSLCPPLRPQGLSADAAGNGLRLSPYFSVGASFKY